MKLSVRVFYVVDPGLGGLVIVSVKKVEVRDAL